MRRSLGIRDQQTLLLYVGRLAVEKNVQTLFTAFEQLTQAARPVAFTCSSSETGRIATACAGWRRAGRMSPGAPTARIPPSSRATTAPPISSSTRACRKHLGSSRWRARRAARPLSAFAAATWIASSSMIRAAGRAKTVRRALADAIQELTLESTGATERSGLRARQRSTHAWPQVFERLFWIYRQVCANYKRAHNQMETRKSIYDSQLPRRRPRGGAAFMLRNRLPRRADRSRLRRPRTLRRFPHHLLHGPRAGVVLGGGDQRRIARLSSRLPQTAAEPALLVLSKHLPLRARAPALRPL